jgi:hypothetical protein
MVKPPKERLAQKLLAGLMQHEPELESLLEGWKESWERVEKERLLLDQIKVRMTRTRGPGP